MSEGRLLVIVLGVCLMYLNVTIMDLTSLNPGLLKIRKSLEGSVDGCQEHRVMLIFHTSSEYVLLLLSTHWFLV